MLEASIVTALGDQALEQGRTADAVPLLERGAELHRLTGRTRKEASARHLLGRAQRALGRRSLADASYAAAHALLSDVGATEALAVLEAERDAP